ncbi:MAG: hypothetical protein WC884_04205 [Candidatus Paceibacterota bacterium]
MRFTQRSLDKFKQLYLKNFGEKLSNEEARRKAEYLLEIYRIAYNTPSTIDFFDNNKEEEEN